MIYFEDNFPAWTPNGVAFKKPVNLTSSLTVTGTTTLSGVVNQTAANGVVVAPIVKNVPVAVNATATLTAAQVASGYITSTSAAATTLTLPTGTLLGTYLGASQGTAFELYIDNTAGANTVTIAAATNGVLSALGAANSASFGLLTIPTGATGIAEFTIVFSSATAYTFTRTA